MTYPRDFYAAQLRGQQIETETGVSIAEQVAMPLEEWSRLAYGKTPAESAIAALQAQGETPGTATSGDPTQTTDASAHTEPTAPDAGPGIDISQLSMSDYAALRERLGMTGREYGRGALDGGGTQDWIAAAQKRGHAGRTSYSQSNVQDAARPDAAKYYDSGGQQVTGRAGFYR